MVLVGIFCVLGAVGLLITGLARADQSLIWASIAASAVGGLAVVGASIQRGRVRRKAAGVTDRPPDASATAPATVPEVIAKRPARAAPTPAAQAPVRGSAADAPEDGSAADAPEDGSAADHEPGELPDGDVHTDPGEDADPADEPGEEDGDIADLLIVIELAEPVLVVDLRPRYHLEGCEHLRNRAGIPLPVNEARDDGFTPCALCRPDSALAAAARLLKAPRQRRPRPGPG